MLEQCSLIRSFKSSIKTNGRECTLGNPIKKKSKGFRSGDRAGHVMFKTIYCNKFVVDNVLQCVHCVLVHHLVRNILNFVTFLKVACE